MNNSYNFTGFTSWNAFQAYFGALNVHTTSGIRLPGFGHYIFSCCFGLLYH